jgi:hypothetical protein
VTPDDPSPLYRRPHALLDGLEAGKPVLMVPADHSTSLNLHRHVYYEHV